VNKTTVYKINYQEIYMSERNARLPTSDYVVGSDVFYVNNTLVPDADGSRIIGPLTPEMLEQKRQQHAGIVSGMTEEQRGDFPFQVYRLTRIE